MALLFIQAGYVRGSASLSAKAYTLGHMDLY